MDNLTLFKICGLALTVSSAVSLVRYQRGAVGILMGLALIVADDYSPTCRRLDEDGTAFIVDSAKLAGNVVATLFVGADRAIRSIHPHP